MNAEIAIVAIALGLSIVVLVLGAFGVIPKKYTALMWAAVVAICSFGAIPLVRKLKKNRLKPEPQTLEELGELTDAEVEALDVEVDDVVKEAKEDAEQIKETLADIDAREEGSRVLGNDDPDAGSLARAKLRELRSRSRKVSGVP